MDTNLQGITIELLGKVKGWQATLTDSPFDANGKLDRTVIRHVGDASHPQQITLRVDGDFVATATRGTLCWTIKHGDDTSTSPLRGLGDDTADRGVETANTIRAMLVGAGIIPASTPHTSSATSLRNLPPEARAKIITRNEIQKMQDALAAKIARAAILEGDDETAKAALLATDAATDAARKTKAAARKAALTVPTPKGKGK